MIWIQNDSVDPIDCPKVGCPKIDPGKTHVHTGKVDRISVHDPAKLARATRRQERAK